VISLKAGKRRSGQATARKHRRAVKPDATFLSRNRGTHEPNCWIPRHSEDRRLRVDRAVDTDHRLAGDPDSVGAEHDANEPVAADDELDGYATLPPHARHLRQEDQTYTLLRQVQYRAMCDLSWQSKAGIGLQFTPRIYVGQLDLHP